MNTKNWFAKIVIVLTLLSIISACSPGSNTMGPKEIESMLTKKEQEKWDLFAEGDIATASELYADDFINLGFTPTGMVRQNKKEAFDMLAQVPPMPGSISLTDFLVVHGDDRSAVVSYKVAAPFGNLFVSSVWVERNGEWKTVFYQASPIFDAAPPVTVTNSIPFSGLFKTDGDIDNKDLLLINTDGSYAVDSGEDGVWGVKGRLEINGDIVTFIDTEGVLVPVCEDNGTYRYAFTGDNLTFTVVDDRCLLRMEYLTQAAWTKQ